MRLLIATVGRRPKRERMPSHLTTTAGLGNSTKASTWSYSEDGFADAEHEVLRLARKTKRSRLRAALRVAALSPQGHDAGSRAGTDGEACAGSSAGEGALERDLRRQVIERQHYLTEFCIKDAVQIAHELPPPPPNKQVYHTQQIGMPTPTYY